MENEWNEILKATYDLKHARDKFDYLSQQKAKVIATYQDEFIKGEVPRDIQELIKLIDEHRDLYKEIAKTEPFPDTVPRSRRGRVNREAHANMIGQGPASSEYITVEQVAEITKYTKGYVYELANPKKHEDPIPRHKINKKILFIESEVKAWLMRQTQKEGPREVTNEEALDIVRRKVFKK